MGPFIIVNASGEFLFECDFIEEALPLMRASEAAREIVRKADGAVVAYKPKKKKRLDEIVLTTTIRGAA